VQQPLRRPSLNQLAEAAQRQQLLRELFALDSAANAAGREVKRLQVEKVVSGEANLAVQMQEDVAAARLQECAVAEQANAGWQGSLGAEIKDLRLLEELVSIMDQLYTQRRRAAQLRAVAQQLQL
jgi:hypothetical protein